MPIACSTVRGGPALFLHGPKVTELEGHPIRIAVRPGALDEPASRAVDLVLKRVVRVQAEIAERRRYPRVARGIRDERAQLAVVVGQEVNAVLAMRAHRGRRGLRR